MRKIIIPIFVMVFVFSLAWIAGAQSSGSDQPGSSQQYGTGKSGSNQQYGGSTSEGKQPGTDQYGTTQQHKGKQSQKSSTGEKNTSKYQGKSMEDQRASKWIGSKIENRQGEDLGKVEDLVLNSKGQVDFVIVSHGGALGIGEKYTAVPFKSFSRKDENTLALNMSKEKMAQAPNFDKDNWPDMNNRQWSEKTYRYYGQKPSWGESPSYKSTKSTQQPSQTEQKKNKME